jgi:hypothetical protein
MSLTVTQRPSTTISGNTSKWNAAKNPIVYKMTRKDFNITAVANSGGALQITVNTNLTTLTTAQGGPVIVGSKIYVQTDELFFYKKVHTVVSVTNAANSVVVFEAGSWVGSGASTGFINLLQRTNYRVSIGVYAAELYDIPGNSVRNNVFLSSLPYSPDPSGSLIIDVATPLLNILLADNLADYVTGFVTHDDRTISLTNLGTGYVKFYIRYTEVWTNSAESETNDTANQFFALYGARQIGELYGGNLAEYVNYENATPLAQFLTKFTRPSIWRGYPFSISTITSDNVSTNSNFRVEYFDATGSTISNNVVTKVANAGKLIRFSPSNALAIPSNAVTAQIRYEKTGIVVLSQTITCEIKDSCSNPIHLYWRNSLGGDAFWMFDFNQNYSYRYDNGRKAERYVLFASNLRDDEFDAISELNTIGEVYDVAYTELTTSVNKSQARIGSQVYMMDATGKKTGVIVIPTEVSTKTKFSRNKIQITIELPEIY